MDKYLNYNLANVKSEDDVTDKVILPLFRELGIIKSDNDYNHKVTVEIQIGRGDRETKQADLVIYKNKQPFIVVESKKKTEKLDDNAVAQLDSYAWGLGATYGVLCNGKDFVLRAYLKGNKRIFLIRRALENLKIKLILDAVSEDDGITEDRVAHQIIDDQSESFSQLLKDIHKKIRDIDHLDPTNAFDGWSKLLFMKISEERWTKEHDGLERFSLSKFLEEKKMDNAKGYIDERFKATCKAYPKIFDESKDKIGLSTDAIEKILELLDGYTINEIPMDVKGKAYEIFLSATFRGKGLGQFFTPRPVVDFMVSIADINLRTVLLDPACGTGGFLIKAYQKMRQSAIDTPDDIFRSWDKTRDEYLGEIKDEHVFGVDAEPRATQTAKMNMIMWGDGENVVRGNGLDVKDYNKAEYPFADKGVSLILANPPFGNNEEDGKVLPMYDLYKDNNVKKTECLFIERALKILKPEGEMAIVIPDGVLVCSNTSCVRKMIRKYARIVAVTSLPKHTFAPSGVPTISTSVLFLKKFPAEYFNRIKDIETEDEIFDIQSKMGLNSYNIFMGVAKEIGYDPNGDASRSGANDLIQIFKEFSKAKSNGFYQSESFKVLEHNCLMISTDKTEDRIDARYYWFKERLSKMKFEKVELDNYIEINSKQTHPKNESPNETFSLVSVTNNYGVILDEDDEKKYQVKGSDIKSAKIIHKGDIAFNPYRINVGSIGIVGSEYDGMLISPAYVVFKTKNGLDAQVLCAILKNPFYNEYIDIFALGSIRTSLSATKLKKILIPKSLIDGDTSFIKKKYSEIDSLNAKIQKKKNEMQDSITSVLR